MKTRMVAAQVTGIEHHATNRGERIYALFQTVEGQTLGIWTAADDALLSHLRAGDAVKFYQDRNGRYHLINKNSKEKL